jgi:hypothetical protein
MVVTMENAIFWDVRACGSCKNRRFGGTYRLHHQGDNNWQDRNNVSGKQQPKYAANKYYVSILCIMYILHLQSLQQESHYILNSLQRGKTNMTL